jgi:5'-3' exonuclease
MNVYIDGDLLVHRCAWGNDIIGFKEKVLDHIDSLMYETMAENGKIAISGKGNFRRDLFPDYKANRKKDEDPERVKLFADAYEFLREELEAVPAIGQEADDLLATWQTEDPGIIISIDKDMLQVPGTHFNNKDWQYIEVTEDEANYNLHKQILMGDPSDNIKGLPRIGAKKAEALLHGRGKDIKKATIKAWKDIYGKGWEEELQLTTDLIYLRRKENDRYLIL